MCSFFCLLIPFQIDSTFVTLEYGIYSWIYMNIYAEFYTNDLKYKCLCRIFKWCFQNSNKKSLRWWTFCSAIFLTINFEFTCLVNHLVGPASFNSHLCDAYIIMLAHGNSCSPWNHNISITVWCSYFDQMWFCFARMCFARWLF